MLKASTFSVWLPSVVGNITQFPNMFLISSLASLAAKVVTLTMAVVLAAAGFQEQIQSINQSKGFLLGKHIDEPS